MVDGEKFEEALLGEADTVMEMWTCSICKIDNKKDSMLCIGCIACKLHGEQECGGCSKKK